MRTIIWDNCNGRKSAIEDRMEESEEWDLFELEETDANLNLLIATGTVTIVQKELFRLKRVVYRAKLFFKVHKATRLLGKRFRCTLQCKETNVWLWFSSVKTMLIWCVTIFINMNDRKNKSRVHIQSYCAGSTALLVEPILRMGQDVGVWL